MCTYLRAPITLGPNPFTAPYVRLQRRVLENLVEIGCRQLRRAQRHRTLVKRRLIFDHHRADARDVAVGERAHSLRHESLVGRSEQVLQSEAMRGHERPWETMRGHERP